MSTGVIAWAPNTIANLAAGIAIGIIVAVAVLAVLRECWLCGLAATGALRMAAERCAQRSCERYEAARELRPFMLVAPDEPPNDILMDLDGETPLGASDVGLKHR